MTSKRSANSDGDGDREFPEAQHKNKKVRIASPQVEEDNAANSAEQPPHHETTDSATAIASVKHKANAGLFDLLVRSSAMANANLQRVASALQQALRTEGQDNEVQKSKVINDHRADVMTVLKDKSLKSLHSEIRLLMAKHSSAVKEAEVKAEADRQFEEEFGEFFTFDGGEGGPSKLESDDA